MVSLRSTDMVENPMRAIQWWKSTCNLNSRGRHNGVHLNDRNHLGASICLITVEATEWCKPPWFPSLASLTLFLSLGEPCQFWWAALWFLPLWLAHCVIIIWCNTMIALSGWPYLGEQLGWIGLGFGPTHSYMFGIYSIKSVPTRPWFELDFGH